MINYCPSCGYKIDKEYKFCPNCGANLEDAKTIEKTYIICENCGEENDVQRKTCKACGVKLEGEEIKRTELNAAVPIEKSKNTVDKKKKEIHPAKKYVQKEKTSGVKETKQLNTAKIATILAVIFVAILVILFASGVFDNGPQFETTVTDNQTPSGVDLSHINEINQLEENVKANPKDTSAILKLAHLRNDSGFFEKAIESYQQYLSIVPSNADARIDMGVCYYNMKEYEKATEAMQTALNYQPDHQIGHLNLGIVNLASGNLEKSREWLKKAVEINPNSEIGKRAQELLVSH